MVDIEPLRYKESTNIDEHNQMVNKINEMAGVLSDLNVDTINTEIADIKTDVGDLSGKVSQVEISTNENTMHLTTVDSTLDNHAREINTIKAKDVSQDTEIQGLTESVVSDLTGNFNNDTRTLKLSIERESAPSIDCSVVIPSGGTTGQYTGGNGINIDSNNVITTKVDDSTIKINSEGKMYSVGGGSGGKTYTAGDGIAISDADVISAKIDDATIKINSEGQLYSVGGKTYTAGFGVTISDSDEISVNTKEVPTASFVSSIISSLQGQITTLKKSTGDAIKPIDIVSSTTALTIKMESLDGQKNIKEIPLATNTTPGIMPSYAKKLVDGTLFPIQNAVEAGYYIDPGVASTAMFVPSVDDVTIHYNDNNKLEVIGGGSSDPKPYLRLDMSSKFPIHVVYHEQANASTTKGFLYTTEVSKYYNLTSFNFFGNSEQVDFSGNGTKRNISDTQFSKTLYICSNWNKNLMDAVAERVRFISYKSSGGSKQIKIKVQLYPISINTESDTTTKVYSNYTTSDLYVEVFLDYSGNILGTNMNTLATAAPMCEFSLVNKTVEVTLCGYIESIQPYID